MLPARCVPGLLHVQTKVDLVCEYLHVPLRLHASAHDTECFPRFAIFHDETRNNGVKRAFAWRVNIRVSRIHRKKFTTILKHEPKTRYHDPAAHPPVIALTQ